MSVDDRERQAEELEALDAIFSPDCATNTDERSWEVWVPARDAKCYVHLKAHLPADYPSRSPPVLQIRGSRLSAGQAEWAHSELQTLFCAGEEVLFTWAQWLRDNEHLWKGPEAQQKEPDQESVPEDERGDATADRHGAMQSVISGANEVEWREGDADGLPEGWDAGGNPGVSSGVQSSHGVPRAVEIVACPTISHGEAFTERKSTFQAHLASVGRLEEVQAVMACLLSNNKVQRATHNIMAFRLHHPATDAFSQDYDDDGETAAGGRLLHLLQVLDARNVVVVVSRWYGGVLLGPARFTHINNAARNLLSAEGYIKQEGQAGSGARKKKK
eukprot:jgi/Botrbrau1/1559/Bobra.0107s0046.1